MATKSGSDLTAVPSLTFSFVETYIQMNSRSAASCDDTSCVTTAGCHRSMKKNESPHKVTVTIEISPVVRVVSASCNCAIGQSQCCGHVTGVLYLMAHYKQRGIKSIPRDIAKTSMPQTWHIPRLDKIAGMSVPEIKVSGYKNDGEDRPVKSTLYNPIRSALAPLEPFLSSLKLNYPDLSLLTTVPQTDEPTPPFVRTNFGLFLKGSTISHQQKLSGNCLINIVDGFYPDLPLSVGQIGDNNCSNVLTASQTTLLDSLSVSQEDAVEIERATRLQAQDNKWVRLRHHRVTASKVGEISKRRKGKHRKTLLTSGFLSLVSLTENF
ncbi:uncharacterized protein [Haliotis asinina]|uniref:uncharacterized protein n=1 Tax=Haliotis asinina TaxID=109174 RepID=UPI0035327B6E